MAFQQHFIIEGKPLGVALRKLQQVHEDRIIPWSQAFVCPTCAEIWARCPVMQGEQMSQFIFQPMACRKHKQTRSSEPSGSLYLSWDKEFSESFPDEVVKWQFHRYLESS